MRCERHSPMKRFSPLNYLPSVHGLYRLQASIACDDKIEGQQSFVCPKLFHVSLEKWHERLGHPSFPTVKDALKCVLSLENIKVR